MKVLADVIKILYLFAYDEYYTKLNRFEWRLAVVKSNGYGLLSPEALINMCLNHAILFNILILGFGADWREADS